MALGITCWQIFNRADLFSIFAGIGLLFGLIVAWIRSVQQLNDPDKNNEKDNT